MSKRQEIETQTRHWDDIWYSAVSYLDAEYPDTCLHFRVYKITAMDIREASGASYPRGWDRVGAVGSPDPVGDIDQAEVFLSGGVKWDGCSNWTFDEQDRCALHFCEREQAETIGVLFGRLYEWAKERGMDRI